MKRSPPLLGITNIKSRLLHILGGNNNLFFELHRIEQFWMLTVEDVQLEKSGEENLDKKLFFKVISDLKIIFKVSNPLILL